VFIGFLEVCPENGTEDGTRTSADERGEAFSSAVAARPAWAPALKIAR
jgi:cell wall assembly regulator SMI1